MNKEKNRSFFIGGDWRNAWVLANLPPLRRKRKSQKTKQFVSSFARISENF